jgi:DNA-binding NarL/FixJ family response regulator
VVIYSWSNDPRLIANTLALGVSGYLSKTLHAAELVEALRAVHAGEQHVSVDFELGGSEPGDWPGRAQGLTRREAEVIALITQGLSNAQIADRASLSINSVKTYIRQSYQKMGVGTRAQAVLWGVHNGFLPDRTRFEIEPARRP